jgi:hypothetical protein
MAALARSCEGVVMKTSGYYWRLGVPSYGTARHLQPDTSLHYGER